MTRDNTFAKHLCKSDAYSSIPQAEISTGCGEIIIDMTSSEMPFIHGLAASLPHTSKKQQQQQKQTSMGERGAQEAHSSRKALEKFIHPMSPDVKCSPFWQLCEHFSGRCGRGKTVQRLGCRGGAAHVPHRCSCSSCWSPFSYLGTEQWVDSLTYCSSGVKQSALFGLCSTL